ncbi:MAG: hypothetical protein HN826_02250 [Methylococcales bacterium]|jgi:hypothetical protein|nr:hypothetical protein [Methylococcales bacterium]
MADVRKQPWYEVDINQIDNLRYDSISSLPQFIADNKAQSLVFAREVFDSHEEKNYDRAIMCMAIQNEQGVPENILNQCLKKDDSSHLEAILYLRRCPNPSLDDALIAYIRRATKESNINKSIHLIEIVIEILAKAKPTQKIYNLFEEQAQIFQESKRIQRLIHDALRKYNI